MQTLIACVRARVRWTSAPTFAPALSNSIVSSAAAARMQTRCCCYRVIFGDFYWAGVLKRRILRVHIHGGKFSYFFPSHMYWYLSNLIVQYADTALINKPVTKNRLFYYPWKTRHTIHTYATPYFLPQVALVHTDN